MSENIYKNVLLSIVYDNKTLTKINSGMDKEAFFIYDDCL